MYTPDTLLILDPGLGLKLVDLLCSLNHIDSSLRVAFPKKASALIPVILQCRSHLLAFKIYRSKRIAQLFSNVEQLILIARVLR